MGSYSFRPGAELGVGKGCLLAAPGSVSTAILGNVGFAHCESTWGGHSLELRDKGQPRLQSPHTVTEYSDHPWGPFCPLRPLPPAPWACLLPQPGKPFSSTDSANVSGGPRAEPELSHLLPFSQKNDGTHQPVPEAQPLSTWG